jgi:hypothetical protein
VSRSVSTAVDSYLTEPVIEFRVLAEIAFVNTTMRLHTGIGQLYVGSTSYDGVGYLGGIEKVEEDAQQQTGPRVRMWITAVDSAPLNEAINETLFNREVKLYRGYLNDGTLVGTPELWMRGRTNEVNLKRGDPERGNYIETYIETELSRERKVSYYTLEDHWMTYSGDTFFAYVPFIPGQKAMWGNKPTYFNTKEGGAQGFTDNFIDIWHHILHGR